MSIALDLNFDGLMIETHTDPDNAWSDAAQQITPSVLVKMMNDLKIRTLTSEEADYKNQLNTTVKDTADVAKQISKIKRPRSTRNSLSIYTTESPKALQRNLKNMGISNKVTLFS